MYVHPNGSWPSWSLCEGIRNHLFSGKKRDHLLWTLLPERNVLIWPINANNAVKRSRSMNGKKTSIDSLMCPFRHVVPPVVTADAWVIGGEISTCDRAICASSRACPCIRQMSPDSHSTAMTVGNRTNGIHLITGAISIFLDHSLSSFMNSIRPFPNIFRTPSWVKTANMSSMRTAIKTAIYSMKLITVKIPILVIACSIHDRLLIVCMWPSASWDMN